MSIEEELTNSNIKKDHDKNEEENSENYELKIIKMIIIKIIMNN